MDGPRRVQFNAINLPCMIEVDYKNWQYPHNCGVPQSTATINNAPQCYVTTIGSRGTSYVPAFTAVNRDVDVRLGIAWSIRTSTSGSDTSGDRPTTAIRT